MNDFKNYKNFEKKNFSYPQKEKEVTMVADLDAAIETAVEQSGLLDYAPAPKKTGVINQMANAVKANPKTTLGLCAGIIGGGYYLYKRFSGKNKTEKKENNAEAKAEATTK